MPVGTEYRRARGEMLYYAVFAALWGGFGVYSLARHGWTSGWFFILAGVFGVGAVRSRRLPYAIVNAESLTVWISPFQSQAVAWRDVVSARRFGPRLRVERAQGKPLNLRWDSVVPEARERFLSELPAHLGSRWTDDPSDTRAESRRLWVLAAAMAAVLIIVLAYLASSGLLRPPVGLP